MTTSKRIACGRTERIEELPVVSVIHTCPVCGVRHGGEKWACPVCEVKPVSRSHLARIRRLNRLKSDDALGSEENVEAFLQKPGGIFPPE
jgi:hypothetical protein